MGTTIKQLRLYYGWREYSWSLMSMSTEEVEDFCTVNMMHASLLAMVSFIIGGLAFAFGADPTISASIALVGGLLAIPPMFMWNRGQGYLLALSRVAPTHGATPEVSGATALGLKVVQ